MKDIMSTDLSVRGKERQNLYIFLKITYEVRTMDQEERRLRRKKDTRQAGIILTVFFCVIAALVVGAVFLVKNFLPDMSKKEEPVEEVTATEDTEETEVETEAAFLPETDAATEQARAYVEGMSLEQKVAQMFMVTPDQLTGVTGVTAAGDTTKSCYMEYPVGGILYQSGNLTGTEQTKTMLSNTMEYSKEATGLPIFLAVEEEGGTIAPIASNMEYGIADAGDMSEIGATGDAQNAYLTGNSIGTYLADLGFNVDLAPVGDIWSNPENTQIEYRSFGSDCNQVKDMVIAELQGLNECGVYGAVKHFPGIGAADGDSSEGTVSTDRTLEELMTEELVPFQGAIDYGAQFIVAGHVSVPAITGNDVPASLSDYMITEVLRNQMGYQGIVMTDAMNQKAVTDVYSSADAAIAAVNAGADIILMPEDFKAAYAAVLEAVQNGTISEERINESVTRIVKVKQQMQ